MRTSFVDDWKFLKSDAEGAEQPSFDDAGWRNLDLPHDWSIEGPFDEKNPAANRGAYLPGGIGWYRKSFSLSTRDRNNKIFIEFDGAYHNSDVWLTVTDKLHVAHWGTWGFRGARAMTGCWSITTLSRTKRTTNGSSVRMNRILLWTGPSWDATGPTAGGRARERWNSNGPAPFRPRIPRPLHLRWHGIHEAG